jgi:hypothetical protein
MATALGVERAGAEPSTAVAVSGEGGLCECVDAKAYGEIAPRINKPLYEEAATVVIGGVSPQYSGAGYEPGAPVGE